MNRTLSLFSIVITLSLWLPVCRAAEQSDLSSKTARPNFVLIFIDDMGYGDIGPFGSQQNRTPHLNRMMREGLKLTSFYAVFAASKNSPEDADCQQNLDNLAASNMSNVGLIYPIGIIVFIFATR